MVSIALELITESNALNNALIKESEAENDNSKITVRINKKDLNKVILKNTAREEQPKQSWANIAANGSRSTGKQSAASAAECKRRLYLHDR